MATFKVFVADLRFFPTTEVQIASIFKLYNLCMNKKVGINYEMAQKQNLEHSANRRYVIMVAVATAENDACLYLFCCPLQIV